MGVDLLYGVEDGGTSLLRGLGCGYTPCLGVQDGGTPPIYDAGWGYNPV